MNKIHILLIISSIMISQYCLLGQGSYRTYSVDDGLSLSKWHMHGKLMYRSISSEGYTLSCFVYVKDNGNDIILSNNINAINEMLKIEIVNRKSSVDFLDSNMLELIMSAMTQDGDMQITNDFVQRYYDCNSCLYKDKVKLKAVVALLDKYKATLKTQFINNDKWSIHFSLISLNGSISVIDVCGTIFPIAITQFTQTIVEPIGTGPKIIMTN